MAAPSQTRTAASTETKAVVRMPDELLEAARQQAAREDRNLSQLIRVAVRRYLEEESPRAAVA